MSQTNHPAQCPTFEKTQVPEFAELREQQRLAVELLVSGRTFASIAQQLGVDVRTIYRWRQEPAFKRTLAALRKQDWGEIAQRLHGMVQPALDVVEQHLAGHRDHVRLRTALSVLRLTNVSKQIANSDEEDDDDE
jgi:hypothetical protein